MPPKKAIKPLLPTDKMPLTEFLRHLNEAGMTMPNAMAVAGKVYKLNNTPEKLGALTAVDLAKLGVNDKEQRTQTLDAFKKYKSTAPRGQAHSVNAVASTSTSGLNGRSAFANEDGDAGGKKKEKEEQEKVMDKAEEIERRRLAALSALQDKFGKNSSPSKKRKRARDDDLFYDSTMSPTAPKYERAHFDFHEVLDESQLVAKMVVINRAPVMMAWAEVVAERLGFEREEALSIASVYTEMNAVTRGANIGIYDKGKEKGMEPGSDSAQPHVELMGRRIALFQTENGQWRALMKGEPVTPEKPFLYMTRSLAQMSPYLFGALTLLAQSFEDIQLLNRRGYSLYCDFRPENTEWGAKGEVKLAKILGLRDVKKKEDTESKSNNETEEKTGEEKKALAAGQTFEEFEALEAEEGDFTLWDLYEGQE